MCPATALWLAHGLGGKKTQRLRPVPAARQQHINHVSCRLGGLGQDPVCSPPPVRSDHEALVGIFPASYGVMQTRLRAPRPNRKTSRMLQRDPTAAPRPQTPVRSRRALCVESGKGQAQGCLGHLLPIQGRIHQPLPDVPLCVSRGVCKPLKGAAPFISTEITTHSTLQPLIVSGHHGAPGVQHGRAQWVLNPPGQMSPFLEICTFYRRR